MGCYCLSASKSFVSLSKVLRLLKSGHTQDPYPRGGRLSGDFRTKGCWISFQFREKEFQWFIFGLLRSPVYPARTCGDLHKNFLSTLLLFGTSLPSQPLCDWLVTVSWLSFPLRDKADFRFIWLLSALLPCLSLQFSPYGPRQSRPDPTLFGSEERLGTPYFWHVKLSSLLILGIFTTRIRIDPVNNII